MERWFYMSTQPAPENTRVLVAIDDPARWVAIANFDTAAGEWRDDEDNPIEYPIHAWMFLPIHPKEANDKVYLALVERYENIQDALNRHLPF